MIHILKNTSDDAAMMLHRCKCNDAASLQFFIYFFIILQNFENFDEFEHFEKKKKNEKVEKLKILQ